MAPSWTESWPDVPQKPSKAWHVPVACTAQAFSGHLAPRARATCAVAKEQRARAGGTRGAGRWWRSQEPKGGVSACPLSPPNGDFIHKGETGLGITVLQQRSSNEIKGPQGPHLPQHRDSRWKAIHPTKSVRPCSWVKWVEMRSKAGRPE